MSHWITEKVRQERIISILRGVPLERMEKTAEALFRGGVRILEITFNQKSESRLEDTARAIETVRKLYGEEMIVGAGTVMSRAEVDAAAKAGAGFMLSPNTNLDVISYGCSRGIEMIPGAMTPSEIDSAYRAGAALIKLFPAGNLGLGYCKAVMGPINHIPMIAVGGVDLDNLRDFLKLGFLGAGIGSNIAKNSLILAGKYDELEMLAASYVKLAKSWEE